MFDTPPPRGHNTLLDGESKGTAMNDRHGMNGRATRTAYFVMLTGLIVVGMVMPFNNNGWKLVNSALLFIVLAETVRYALILIGYRSPRLAH